MAIVVAHGAICFVRSFGTLRGIGTALGRHEERVSMTLGWSNERYTMSLGVRKYWQDSSAGRTKQQNGVSP